MIQCLNHVVCFTPDSQIRWSMNSFRLVRVTSHYHCHQWCGPSKTQTTYRLCGPQTPPHIKNSYTCLYLYCALCFHVKSQVTDVFTSQRSFIDSLLKKHFLAPKKVSFYKINKFEGKIPTFYLFLIICYDVFMLNITMKCSQAKKLVSTTVSNLEHPDLWLQLL